MMKLLLPLTIVLFVVACAPRDIPVERSDGGFNNKGGKGSGGGAKIDPKESFVLTEKGELSKTCAKGVAFKTLIVPESDVEGILDGSIRGFVDAGNRNCFKIGSALDVKTDFASDEVLGQVVVSKTEALAASKLTQKHADAFGLSLEDLEARAEEEMEKAPKKEKGAFDPKGMITITYFKTAGADEDTANEPSDVEQELHTLVFTKIGDRSTTCSKKSKTWAYISIPQEQDENIKAGKVFGWMSVGEKNCFEIGSQIVLQEKNGPERAKLKVLRVEIVPLVQLTVMHSSSMGLSYAEFYELAETSLESINDPKKMVNMTFFEYIADSTSTAR